MDKALQNGRVSHTLDEGGSLKDRLLPLMVSMADDKGWLKGITTRDLAMKIGASEHDVVHLITDSLHKMNMVTYRENDGHLIRLRVTPPAMGRSYAPGTLMNKKYRDRAPAIIDAAVEEFVDTFTPHFPLIQKIVSRRAHLLEAAKIAEEADAVELAIQLSDKADIPLTPLEKECVELFNLWVNA